VSHARCALADGHVLLIRELVFFREGIRPVDRVARHGQQNGILVDEASESPGHDECLLRFYYFWADVSLVNFTFNFLHF